MARQQRLSWSFNPSIGLTSVPTVNQVNWRGNTVKFQSLNRAYKRSDEDDSLCRAKKASFQSLNRAYKRSDKSEKKRHRVAGGFQSLNRAYKRSDATKKFRLMKYCIVSIPQSGLQAFRLVLVSFRCVTTVSVSIPQSGLQAFRR